MLGLRIRRIQDSQDLSEALAFSYSRISRFLSFFALGKLSDCLPPETRILLDSLLNTRSFAIYNPKERKPGVSDAPRERSGKSRGNEICRCEKSPRKAFSLSLSFLSSREFSTAKTRRAPNKRRKFQVPPRENRTSSRERECKRAAFLQPRVDSGFISEERRPVKCKKVREKFRGVLRTFVTEAESQ